MQAKFYPPAPQTAPERIWAKCDEVHGSIQIGSWADTIRQAPEGIEYLRGDIALEILAASAGLMAEVGRLTALVEEAREVVERQHEYNGEGDCDCSLCHDSRAFLAKIAAATEAQP